MGGACGTYGGDKCIYRLLVGKILRKKLLGGIRRSWERTILKYILRNRMVQHGQDSSGKVANACKGDSETSSCMKFGELLD